MNGLPHATRADALIQAYMDGALSEEQEQALRAWLAEDPEHIREFVRQIQLDLALWDCHAAAATLQESIPVCMADRTQPAASGLRIVHGQVPNQAEAAIVGGNDAQPRRWARWLAPLVMAASLAIVVGGWWFGSGRQPAGLGLRVVEVAGTATIENGRLQIEDRKSDNPLAASGVRRHESSKSSPVVVGMALCQGDRLVVSRGGKVALKYDGEATTIDLHSAVASFGAEQGAKRVRLESGLLLCTAAPQAKPFRFKTPHAVATVVGTRFALDAGKGETTLAVREGTVALTQGTNRLEVVAGGSAAAGGRGLRLLTPADAWLRDLLMRAEAAPWDTLKFASGAAIGAAGDWRVASGASPAERRIWQYATSPEGSAVLFDEPRWGQAVIIGRVMLLPEDPLPAALVAPAQARPAAQRVISATCSQPISPVSAILFAPSGGGSIVTRELSIPCSSRAVWYRFLIYFNTRASAAAWIGATLPDELKEQPVAGQIELSTALQYWDVHVDKPCGLGLASQGGRVLWEGVKLVPLGEELPLPPKDGWRRKP